METVEQLRKKFINGLAPEFSTKLRKLDFILINERIEEVLAREEQPTWEKFNLELLSYHRTAHSSFREALDRISIAPTGSLTYKGLEYRPSDLGDF